MNRKVKIVKQKTTGKITKTVTQHRIFGDWKPGSFADYVQLKRYYRDLELKDLGFLETQEWYVRLKFTTSFLKEKEKEHGSLKCVYCGKTDLVIYPHDAKNKIMKKMATADHFIPNNAKVLDYYTKWNLLVSCHKCNNKKGAKIPTLNDIKHINEGEYKLLFDKSPKYINMLRL